MRKAVAISLGLITTAIIGATAIIGIDTISETANTAARTAAEDVRANAANVVIESGDLKGKITATLDEYRPAIAAATGMSEPEVDAAIADLDIAHWEATPLPNDVVVTDTYSSTYAGVDASITTYDNPNYLTVNAYGQTITMRVPESAQPSIGSLGYLKQLQP
ncbi:MAG: hypothetical protein RR955_01340 [Raoultibacter sp.]